MCQFLSTVFICEHSRKMPTSVLTIHIYMYIFHKKWLSQEFCAFSPSLRTAKDPFVRHRCHRRPINPKPKHHQENGAFQQSAQRENIQHISTHTKVVPHSWACFRSSLNQVLLVDISVIQKDLKRPRQDLSTWWGITLQPRYLSNRWGWIKLDSNRWGYQKDMMGMAYPTLLCIYIYVYWLVV